MSTWISDLLGLNASAAPPGGWAPCDLANATICPLTEAFAGASSGSISLVLYNSKSVSWSAPVRVPVPVPPASAVWTVVGPSGAPSSVVAAQLVPPTLSDDALRTTYYGLPKASMAWLCFLSPPIPAAGYTTVFLTLAPSSASLPDAAAAAHPSVVTPVALGGDGALSAGAPTLTNGIITLGFDGTTGQLSGFASTAPGVPAVPGLSHAFLYYPSSTGGE